MKTIILLCTLTALHAQKHELGLTIGRVAAQDRTISSTAVDLGAGTALQANYGVRIAGAGPVAIYGAVNFLASPLRDVASANRASIRDFATIYLTPEIRVKFAPGGAVSPYVFGGGGLAVYEQSELTIGGAANASGRTSKTGALAYGAGVDIKGFRWLGFRGELRDNFTGSPRFNFTSSAPRQHNWSVTGGIVLRFGE